MAAGSQAVKKTTARKRTPKPSWEVKSSQEWAIYLKGNYSTDNDVEDLYQALTSLRNNTLDGTLKGYVIDEIDSWVDDKPGYCAYYLKRK